MTATAAETGRPAVGVRTQAAIERVAAVDPWWWALALMVSAWTWYFTELTLDVHHGLGTSSYDYGLYDQGLWLLSRFDAPFVTLMGRNLFGDHTSFILVFLVPLFWIAPSAGALLFAQSAAVAAGAVPIFAYARRRLDSGGLALCCAAMYLLHPAVGWTNLENFHPDSFSGMLVGAAVFGALERRWRLYVVFAVLALLVKEDVALVLVPLGIWVALRRDRRIGIATIVGSVGFMLVAMFVVMRGLTGEAARNTWRIPFGGPGGLIKRTVTDPNAVIDHLGSDGRPFYLWQMLTPLAWIASRLPSAAMIGAGVLAGNVVSTYAYQYDVRYHYSMIAVPALAMGAVYALGAVEQGARNVVVAAGLLVSLATAALWGPLPFARDEPGYLAPTEPVAVAAGELVDAIPDDAVISVHHSLAPHLSRRTEIYQFPNPFRVVLYEDVEIEGTRLEDRAERVAYVALPVVKSQEEQLDFARISAAFTLVERNDHWELYRRQGELPPP